LIAAREAFLDRYGKDLHCEGFSRQLLLIVGRCMATAGDVSAPRPLIDTRATHGTPVTPEELCPAGLGFDRITATIGRLETCDRILALANNSTE
jgi:hypothetical protein